LAKQRASYYAASGEVHQFTVSLLAFVYGQESPQMRAYQADVGAISKSKDGSVPGQMFDLAQGTLRNVKAEVEGGLVENWRAQIAGELLAELVRLGKEILSDEADEAKNVGAVLIAAAFEGTLRRLGEEQAGVIGRPPMQDVISSLKTADVLKGGQVHTANGYLKFRNDSLHADWQNLDRPQIEGCILFLESLFEKHFS